MNSSAKAVKIAVISDLHYGSRGIISRRRSDIADILLLRTIQQLNRIIYPDMTLVLGDLLDDGAAGNAQEQLKYIRSILDRLITPYIAIPGNHDPDPETFYRVFSRPEDIKDAGGVRYLSFIDKEAPGYNASRDPAGIARLRTARNNYKGLIVALQHVCLSPPDKPAAPYNYTNASDIISAMKDAAIELSVSGHFHDGTDNTMSGNTMFVNAPALCETPFQFMLITLKDGQVQTQRHQLLLPENAHVIDAHVHTQLAFCSANMNVEKAEKLALDFGIGGIGFAEHSGQLYFDNQRYWNGACMLEGMAGARESDNRMAAYQALRKAHAGDKVRFGLEVDCDYKGNLLLKSGDRSQIDYIIGAIHGLSTLSRKGEMLTPASCDEFLFLLEKLLENKVDIVAHPFRVFRRIGLEPPQSLLLPTAKLLKKYRTAAEINFHINEPSLEFTKICLDMGVKFTFASDAHELFEIGNFAFQLDLLKKAGFNGDLSDILAPLGITGAI